jgi:hypothetical protein
VIGAVSPSTGDDDAGGGVGVTGVRSVSDIGLPWGIAGLAGTSEWDVIDSGCPDRTPVRLDVLFRRLFGDPDVRG